MARRTDPQQRAVLTLHDLPLVRAANASTPGSPQQQTSRASMKWCALPAPGSGLKEFVRGAVNTAASASLASSPVCGSIPTLAYAAAP